MHVILGLVLTCVKDQPERVQPPPQLLEAFEMIETVWAHRLKGPSHLNVVYVIHQQTEKVPFCHAHQWAEKVSARSATVDVAHISIKRRA